MKKWNDEPPPADETERVRRKKPKLEPEKRVPKKKGRTGKRHIQSNPGMW